MKMGILGSGGVGQTISARLIELGHDVMIGTRDTTKLVQWQTANQKGKLGSFSDAARFGEMIFNATSGGGSLNALGMAGKENLKDKILVDISNPLDYSKGFPPFLFVSNTDSLAEQIQREFPQTKVVKSLNTINAQVMVYPQKVGGGNHTVFVGGDDQAAKIQVIDLLRSFGWADIMDLGDLSSSRGTEAYLLLWVRMYSKVQTSLINVKVTQ